MMFKNTINDKTHDFGDQLIDSVDREVMNETRTEWLKFKNNNLPLTFSYFNFKFTDLLLIVLIIKYKEILLTKNMPKQKAAPKSKT